MKTTFFLIIINALFSITMLAQNMEWPNKSELEHNVDQLFNKWNDENSSGCVISIVQGGEIKYLQGYGMANLEHGIPNHPRLSRYNIASVAKQFTSFAILLLEKDGKLSLNDDIRKYIPELPDFGHNITLKHLATHTSGLRDQWDLLKIAGWRMDDVITNQHAFNLIQRQEELNFIPGDEFRYSNTGHTLLAEVVSRASKKSFASFVQQEIFDPLGMTNSFFLDDHQMLVKNLADSYDGSKSGGFKKSHMLISSVGATNLYSTAEDMAKWAMNFDQHIVGDAQIIYKLNKAPFLNNGEKGEYALGQFPITYKGLIAFDHSGAEAAYESYFIRIPKHQFAVSVLANSGSFWAEGLGRRIVDIYLKDYLEDIEQPPSIDSQTNEIIKLPFGVLNGYEGQYWSEDQSLQREILLKKDTLYYTRSNSSASKLLPINDNTFLMEDQSVGVRIEFLKMNTGYAMNFIDNHDTIRFIPILHVDIAEYTGTYYSRELQTYYHLNVLDDQLIASHQRNPDILIHPVQKNRFHSRTWFFKNISFQRDENDKVVGFQISNRGVTNLSFLKVELYDE